MSNYRQRLLTGYVLLQCFTPLACKAEVTSVPAPALQAPAAPEPRGRLFHAPEKRIALDNARKNGQSQSKNVELDSVRYDGLVARSSGKNTYWINANPVTEKSPASPFRLEATSGALLLPDANGNKMRIKPGTAIDRNSGATTDALAGGRATASPR